MIRFLARPRLGVWLAVLAVLLTSPALFVGFQLDDYVGRYVYSNREGAERLYQLVSAGYGMANGNPADTHWQIEMGYLPWWTDAKILISFFRPLSLVTHLLDARFWPETSWAMHAQSLLWLALLIVAATRLYRGTVGPVVGGLAALLLAMDHNHGYIVGFTPNRHALIATTFGLLCLDAHARAATMPGSPVKMRFLAAVLYVATLLSSEFGISIAAYLLAHATFVESGTPSNRLRSVAPYFAITVLWRIGYGWLGHGVHGSGVYVDPVGDPVHFAQVFLVRAPVLLLAQFFLPPAELFAFYSPVVLAVLWCVAAVFCVGAAIGVAPRLRASPTARFWAAGMLLSLIPACAAYPNGRQLLLTSVGAMALIAEWWDGFVTDASNRGSRSVAPPLGAWFVAPAFLLHLAISPWGLPLSTFSVTTLGSFGRAADALGDEITGKTLVVLSATDFFAPRIAELRKRTEGGALPRRWRTISGGPERVTLTREDDKTLVARYEGGLFSLDYTELYRDRRVPMRSGYRVTLDGLVITVRESTDDGRPTVVAFAFDTPLDSPEFVFYAWDHGTFVPFTIPPPHGTVVLPPTKLELGPWLKEGIGT